MSYAGEYDQIEAAAEREIRAIEKHHEHALEVLGGVIERREARILELTAENAQLRDLLAGPTS